MTVQSRRDSDADELHLRTLSRRFIPTSEQAHHDPLLLALYRAGATEAQVI